MQPDAGIGDVTDLAILSQLNLVLAYGSERFVMERAYALDLALDLFAAGVLRVVEVGSWRAFALDALIRSLVSDAYGDARHAALEEGVLIENAETSIRRAAVRIAYRRIGTFADKIAAQRL